MYYPDELSSSIPPYVEIVTGSKNEDLFFWTGIQQDGDTFINEYTEEPIEWDPNFYPGPGKKHASK